MKVHKQKKIPSILNQKITAYIKYLNYMERTLKKKKFLVQLMVIYLLGDVKVSRQFKLGS